MISTCECGMNVESITRRTECPECGTACCRSCAIDVDELTRCRWCAASAGC